MPGENSNGPITRQRPANFREAALWYVEVRGWRVIPLRPGTKRPVYDEWQRSDYSRDEVSQIFSQSEVYNIGLQLGLQRDGKILVDLDLDCREAMLIAPFYLPPTGSRFGRRGRGASSHWVYIVTDDISTHQFLDPEADGPNSTQSLIEIRAGGAQTMVPPSIHPAGMPVVWASNEYPPEVIAVQIIGPAKMVAAGALIARHWPEGGRHQAALALSGWLLRDGWEVEEVEKFIDAVCQAAGDEEVADRLRAVRDTAGALSEADIVTGFPRFAEVMGDRVAQKAREWIGRTRQGSGIPLTDEGNAQRMAEHFSDVAKYVPGPDCWHIWHGDLWIKDHDNHRIVGISAQVARVLMEEARNVDEDQYKKYLAAAASCGMLARARAIAGFAETMDAMRLDVSQLDSDPLLLNCSNGTVNLETGGLLPHNPAHFITRMAPVSYDPRARSDSWEMLIRDVFPDEEERTALQILMGYSMTGLTTEEIFVMAYGLPASGKGAVIETLAFLLGGYGQKTVSEAFLSTRGTSPGSTAASPYIAQMAGARMIVSDELPTGRRFNESIIKTMTGRDAVTARPLYRSPFTFWPTGKIWLQGNTRPKINDVSGGTWRRLVMMPFRHPVPPEQQDKYLKDRIRGEESKGVFAWGVKGARMYFEHGLIIPESWKAEARDYQEENDTLLEFINENCEIGDNLEVRSSDLYSAYTAWAQRHDEQRPMAMNNFVSYCRDRGHLAVRHHNIRFIQGLALRTIEMTE